MGTKFPNLMQPSREDFRLGRQVRITDFGIVYHHSVLRLVTKQTSRDHPLLFSHKAGLSAAQFRVTLMNYGDDLFTQFPHRHSLKYQLD